MQPQRIRITVDGKRATTVDLAAAEHELSHDAMAKAIRRGKVEPFDDAQIGRILLYPHAEVSRALRERPGVPGRPRKAAGRGSAPTEGARDAG
jgi:hypothetical protein